LRQSLRLNARLERYLTYCAFNIEKAKGLNAQLEPLYSSRLPAYRHELRSAHIEQSPPSDGNDGMQL
jgi:hypothetical protein